MENQILTANLSVVVGFFVKILMVMLSLMSLVMVRQSGLMDRVLNVPIGNWFKTTTFLFFVICLLFTLLTFLIV